MKRHARYYDEAVADCPWLELQRGPDHAEHSFYHWAATFRGEKQGIALEDFTAAVREAGLSSVSVGYTKIPAYCHPVIRDQLAHAFHCPENRDNRKSYGHGLCPVAEEIIPRLVLGYLVEPEAMAKREAEELSGAIRRLQRG